MKYELDRSLRSVGIETFGDISLFRESFLWLKKHPDTLRTRVSALNEASGDISEMVVLGDFNKREKPAITALRRVYIETRSEPPLSVRDLTSSYNDAQTNPYPGGSEIIEAIDSSLSGLREGILSGEVKFHPEVLAHPPTFMSKLMIEAAALAQAALYKKPEVAQIYEDALIETLTQEMYPDSNLKDDITYWTELERDSSSLVSLAEFTAAQNLTANIPLRHTALELNRYFREGGIALNVLDQLRKFPRPIMVDFNNVIANNESPLQLNPDAPKFLEDLREIGSVIIITHASYWTGLQGFMVANGIWHPGMVLMTWPTYEFLGNRDEYTDENRKLREDFNQMASQAFGKEFDEFELEAAASGKKVAMLFNKPWEIPIIDDTLTPTTNNPGMRGVQVQCWEPNPTKSTVARNKSLPSLPEATKTVRDHYSRISQ